MKTFVNVFCCLVHEEPDVIWDLVRNLRSLDPASAVLLYNNSGDQTLLEDSRFHTDPQVSVYPEPRHHPYGRLHGYMTDCMAWAGENLPFDTLTNVDSDQLLLRPGYSDRLAQIAEQNPNIGLLGSSPATKQWPRIAIVGRSGLPLLPYPQRTALQEIFSWRLFLKRYKGALDRFPQWTFWPGTVFSRQACLQILGLLDDSLLSTIIRRSRIFATEEIILPTLVDVLGFDLVQTPFDQTYVQFRSQYTLSDMEESLQVPNRFWIHPVPRKMDHPLRTHLRNYHHEYDVPVDNV